MLLTRYCNADVCLTVLCGQGKTVCLPVLSPSEGIAGQAYSIFVHSLHSSLRDGNNMLSVAPLLCPVMLVDLLSMMTLTKGKPFGQMKTQLQARPAQFSRAATCGGKGGYRHEIVTNSIISCRLAAKRVQCLQMEKAERPRPLDDPTRPYIKFDIVAHLDALSSHEGTKRVSSHRLPSSSQCLASQTPEKLTLCYLPSPALVFKS